jgi:hypothetical protein
MEIDINGICVQFYVDTGVEVNTISKDTFDYTGTPSLQKCDKVACMYNGQTATKPWECIHIDFAGRHLGRHFLIVVDAYSKYPDVI